jgi:hypothetical protein
MTAMTGVKTRWVLAAALLMAGSSAVYAARGAGGGGLGVGGGAGIQGPPNPGTGTPPALATPAPVIPPIIFSTNPANIHGFDVTGFIQDATVWTTGGATSACPALPQKQQGGSLKVNGLTITIPCNVTLQMPAATFTWSDMFNSFTTGVGVAPGNLKLTAARGTVTASSFPSTEISVTGNIVNGVHIAGLVLVSQQSLNGAVGYVVGLDGANGVLLVGSSLTDPNPVRVQINDPTGRYSIGKSPDDRFSVDPDNPTIKSSSGYPMCIPRDGADKKCPARNRPLVNVFAVNGGCRNIFDAGVTLPTGRDLAPPVAGQIYCSSFVMQDPATVPDPTLINPPVATHHPTSFAQVPFVVGDFVTYAGTLFRGQGRFAGGVLGSDFISAHTVEANVGVFTQPGTLPAYVAIGGFIVGADAPATFNGIPQEAQNKLILEANTTDVTSIADIYLMDISLANGTTIANRWVTPANMTGGVGAAGSNGTLIDGGLTTQFTGPQPGRIRIAAGKATPGILASPTRYLRVALRSLCDPANINSTVRVSTPVQANTFANPFPPQGGANTVQCLDRAIAANGLKTGQYLAPAFEFIFPENVTAGDPPVPYNFWALDFLVSGEGPGTGQLIPRPW